MVPVIFLLLLSPALAAIKPKKGRPAHQVTPRHLNATAEGAERSFLLLGAEKDVSRAQDAEERLVVDRPKLAAGCASSSTSLLAGAVALALGAAWWIGFSLLLRNPARTDASDSPRLPILDAAKFMLMIPVINEHTTFWYGPMTLQGMMQFVHLHTRTFCFVSGCTAKSAVNEKAVQGVVCRLIFPTILWQLCMYFYVDHGTVAQKKPQDQVLYLFNAILTAPGISWYMYALATWRVLGWALLTLKPATRAVVAVLIMIISGYMIDTPGFLRNAGVYFPLFVAGQLFPLKEILARLPPTLDAGTLAAGVAMLSLIACWEFSTSGLNFLSEIPYYSWGAFEGPHDGYCSFGAYSTFWLRGAFRNMLELTKGLVLILFCCPRQDSTLSKLGQYSLYTYLLHPWFQEFMNEVLMMHSWRPHPTVHSSMAFQWSCVAGSIFYAIFMNLVLTSQPCTLIFKYILEPAWLERLVAVEPAKHAPSAKTV